MTSIEKIKELKRQFNFLKKDVLKEVLERTKNINLKLSNNEELSQVIAENDVASNCYILVNGRSMSKNYNDCEYLLAYSIEKELIVVSSLVYDDFFYQDVDLSTFKDAFKWIDMEQLEILITTLDKIEKSKELIYDDIV